MKTLLCSISHLVSWLAFLLAQYLPDLVLCRTLTKSGIVLVAAVAGSSSSTVKPEAEVGPGDDVAPEAGERLLGRSAGRRGRGLQEDAADQGRVWDELIRRIWVGL